MRKQVIERWGDVIYGDMRHVQPRGALARVYGYLNCGCSAYTAIANTLLARR